MSKRGIVLAVATVSAVLLLAGCFGPSVVKLMRLTPSESGGNRQEKSGVIMEVTPVDEVAINENKFPELVFKYNPDPSNPFGSAVSYYLLGNYVQFKVSVTNRTGHVLRFTGAVVKLIDEAGNMYDAFTKEECGATYVGTAQAGEASSRLRTLKYLDPNVEILPDMTWNGYIAFNLRPKDAGELVKFAVYDLVTKTDEAGNPKEKSRFEFNFKKEVIEKKG